MYADLKGEDKKAAYAWMQSDYEQGYLNIEPVSLWHTVNYLERNVDADNSIVTSSDRYANTS